MRGGSGRPGPGAAVVLREIRLAARLLFRAPAFACCAVVALALGIGAGTAIFGVVNAVALKPLVAPHAAELVRFSLVERGDVSRRAVLAPEVVRRLLETPHASLMQVSAFRGVRLAASFRGNTRPVLTESVAGPYFDALGIPAVAGRVLGPVDHDAAASGVAVVSERLWRTWMQAAPDALGDTIVVAGRRLTVVGIVAAAFKGLAGPNLTSTDLWVPSQAMPAGARPVAFVFARLRPGFDVERADAEVRVLHGTLDPAHPGRGLIAQAGVIPRPPASLYLAGSALVTVSGLVLAIVAASLTNLLLARGFGRRAEIAIRLALGAGRGDITRLLAIEVGLLTLAAGALAVGIAFATARALSGSLLPSAPFIVSLDASPDWRVFLYTAVASTSVAVGIVAALAAQASRVDALAALTSSGGAGGATWRGGAVRLRLVASQVAGSTVLLVIAGVFVRSTLTELAFDPGYAPAGAAIGWIDHDEQGHDAARASGVQDRLLRELRATPGVTHAALASQLPGNRSGAYVHVVSDAAGPRSTYLRRVTEDFFAAIRLPVRRGRVFTADETARADAVVVVSESAAAALWPKLDPIGRTLQFVRPSDTPGGAASLAQRTEPFRVVGVVADARTRSPDPRDRQVVFLPFDAYDPGGERGVALVVRAASDAAALQALRLSVQRAHPEITLYAHTLQEEIATGAAALRLTATVLASVGLLGALIAFTGLYGVIAHLAVQRRRELSIMRALGARPPALYRMIAADGCRTLLIGILPGLALAVGCGFVLRQYFWDLDPLDWQALTAVPATVLLVGLLATLLPFRSLLRQDTYAELRGL